jgi:predicted metal-binding membrane protein
MTALGVFPGRRSIMAPAIVAAAWAMVLIADLTGVASRLHHHALIENGPPLPIATVLFLVGWIVMVAAMMVPASLRAIEAVGVATERSPSVRRAAERGEFLGAFAVVWAAFGLLAFFGDDVLHHVVDATPWLAARPWLISAGILALAGAIQFAPGKRRSLAACRHPVLAVSRTTLHPVAIRHIGFRHGLDCLGASWALMLLMFAEGFANPVWMAALTALMVYEVNGRHARRAVSVSGVVLLLIALATLTGAA